MRTLRDLYSDVKHYGRLTEELGADLSEFAGRVEPKVWSAMIVSYKAASRGLLLAYGDVRKALIGSLRSNPPRLSLERIETLFLSLRGKWDATSHLAARLKKKGQERAARTAYETADGLERELVRVARMLFVEADRSGRWTAEWERELGLKVWLR